jgi:hypothetical protein
MNKEQQELLNDAYENYSKEYEKDNSIGMCLLVARLDGKKTYRKPDKEMFVGLCTSDKTFSEKWGLKIEERELSFEERHMLWDDEGKEANVSPYMEKQLSSMLDELNIPTKLITISYNDIKLERYE